MGGLLGGMGDLGIVLIDCFRIAWLVYWALA